MPDFDVSLLPEILSQSPLFVTVLSLDGRMLWLNRYAYGYDRSVDGTSADPIILPEDIPVWLDAFRRAVSGERDVGYTVRLRIPTPPGWVRVVGKLSPVSIDGAVKYVIAVTLDATVGGIDPYSNCASGCSPACLPVSAPRQGHEDHVTLSQAAAIVGRSKEALRHYRDLPAPVVVGGGGQRSLYSWAEMRPWLERTFNRRLPERFPSLRPPRG